MKIQVVDLFCGGGGFSEGAIQAGANVVLAVDFWEEALKVHRENHPQTPCLNIELGGPIDEMVDLIKSYIDPSIHFHLHGSPPCQALSTASNRDGDEGMVLVEWFLKLVEELKPDSWSMENVVPLGKRLKEKHPLINFEILNAADFGTPQTRKRVFAGSGWIARKTHDQSNWVSVFEALPHIEKEIFQYGLNQFRIVSRRRKAGEEPQHYSPQKPAHTITRLPHIIETGEIPVSIRSLTIEESGILQGFPPHYVWPYERKKDGWTIVGNAVCPNVAKAVIKGIEEYQNSTLTNFLKGRK